MCGRLTNQSIRYSLMMMLVISACIFFSGSFAVSEDEEVANYGRIRYTENGITLIRSGEGVTEEGTLNAPIFPGDTAETGSDQRAEIQLADSSFLRLDHATRIQFQALSDMYNKYELSTILKLFNGDIYIEAKNMDDKDKNFQIDTPFASIYLLTNGTFKINVNSEQRVEVYSYSGVAEVVGELNSVLLRSGKMTFVSYKSNPADPRAFNSFYGDGFDDWNNERDEFYSNARIDDEYYEDLPDETRSYYSELSYYGGWVNIPVYGYVWYPYGTYAGWRPYYDGYWCWGPGGYFWVSYEPWGWAPYHYGRWSWIYGYGWVWVPGSVFCGAWVAWSYGPYYMGWCPLDYWDRPCFIGLDLYLDCYDFRTWNFIDYRDVTSRNVRHAVLRQNVVEKDLKDAVIQRSAPRLRPRELSKDSDIRHSFIKNAHENREERILQKSKERIPTLPNFRDQEKSRTEQLHSRIPKRTTNPENQGTTQQKGRPDIKSNNGDRQLPEIRRSTDEKQEHTGASPERQKQTRANDREQPSPEKRQDTPKSYPRSPIREHQIEPTNERVTERQSQAGKKQEQGNYKDQEMKTYQRRYSEDSTLRSTQQERRQQQYRESTVRVPEQDRYQSEPQQNPRNYQRKETQQDPNYRLQKMLRDMSQTPRTHEVQKRETPPPRESAREAPTRKPSEKSSSSGQSRSSSGRSQSGGRQSKGR